MTVGEMKGKTIADVIEGRNAAGPWIDIHFTDGTKARISACCCLGIEDDE